MEALRVGLIGCGNISGIYLKNLTGRFRYAKIIACADVIAARAAQCAQEYGVSALSPQEMLESGNIDVVLNLTIPEEHARISLQALQNGKHVYSEKPLALTLEDADSILQTADRNKLMAGCAPDTFLGCGLQTAQKLLRDGWLGKPVAASAAMTCRGHERWHPNPDFYYSELSGPMFDMGPYYLTAMISMLGPVESVCAMSRRTFDKRVITGSVRYGESIDVKTDTHYSISLLFASGLIANMIMSFDIWHSTMPHIEIYGEYASMICPDPNTFAGPVSIRGMHSEKWENAVELHPYFGDSRGLGLSEMCRAVMSGEKPIASGELARHVLEVIHAVLRSAREGRQVSCAKPDIPQVLRGLSHADLLYSQIT